MDQKEFDAMMARADAAAAARKPAKTPSQLDAEGRRPDGTLYSEPPRNEPGLGDASGLDAIAGGVLKSGFESKDFLLGETAREDRSEFRKSVEDTVRLRTEQSMLDGLSAGVGQFAGAMIGLGKVSAVAKALPWFGKGFGAIVSAAPKTAEVGKAALAGATAFDPHEERLSNLIQKTPLANDFNRWLAADPMDSAAEGRLKAALESIGMDLAIIGTFMGAGRVWKHLRNGDADGASHAVDDMEAAQRQHIADAERAEMEAGEPFNLDMPLDDSGKAVEGLQASPAQGAEELPEGAQRPAVSQGEPLANPDGAVPAKADLEAPEGAPRAETGEGGPSIPDPLNANPEPAPRQYRIQLATEDTEAVLKAISDDVDAMDRHGSWDAALKAGHTFGRGAKVPYAKLNNPPEVDAFLARLVDASEERLDRMKGGSVLTDETVTALVARRAALFNEDPAQLLKEIHQAGADATHAVANMEAGYLVSSKLMQDSFALAMRIKLGDLSEFGSREAALEALKTRMALASSVYGAARSITAASGRAVRRMRTDFKIDPNALEQMRGLDGDRLADLLVETGGRPQSIAKLTNPTLLSKAVDGLSYLYVNNLLSGPMTHAVNAISNAYMLGARPMERILGAAPQALRGDGPSQIIVEEALKQYAYTGAALMDGFRLASKAFLRNDSILAPHQLAEAWTGGVPSQRSALSQPMRYRAWKNEGDILHTALQVGTAAVGLPMRALGTVDELVKQTVYRSKVMARAHVAAAKEGMAAGLTGKDLKAHIRQSVASKLDGAFDADGRALDKAALHEAQVATFSQELGTRTFGRTVQNAVAQHPSLRFVMPFVRTPVNILRYAWKMTPGLNLAQKEFQEALNGKLGREAQAQAAGQMAMGSLFIGSTAFVVSQGHITGGGPKDYRQLEALKATGWQPYSVVVEHDDGSKTYVPLDRMDPFAMIVGTVADITDAMHLLENEEAPEIGAAMGSLLIAASRQFSNKNFLRGAGVWLEALSDPEASVGRVAGQLGSNLVPYSAALRYLNNDPYLREAREVTDRLIASVPGLSKGLPARYDAWGDPMVTRKGLWSSSEDQEVDMELQRLVLQGGSAPMRPNPVVTGGVDLRDITMSSGENAFEAYQRIAGHPKPGRTLKAHVGRLIDTRKYRLAPDGDATTKGTKQWLLSGIFAQYRSFALKQLRRDPVVREAFRADALKVRNQYRENVKANPKPDTPMKKLGKSFGVDLKNL